MNKLAAMNKVAALRSVARRSVLTKAAADWGQFAGPAAMALGGALGGSAVTGDDQSMLKRIGKGTLGAGLAYGGYKLMTDPKWQATARTGVEKAKNLISQLIGQKKAAEAQDAYVAGFCKAAEAMGVDPDTLAKAADLSGYTWGWHDELKDPPPDPVHEIAAKLKDKQDRGIDIEQYRTGTARNIAATVAQLGLGGVTTVTAPAVLNAIAGKVVDEGMVPFGANKWIRHVRKLAPHFSARHSGVAKALGRLANTGTKGGLAALIAGSAILPAWFGINGIRGALHRANINKAIDRVKAGK